jgi:hypothetical protein
MGVAGGELLIPTIVLLYGVANSPAASSCHLPAHMPVVIARYSRDQASPCYVKTRPSSSQ